MEAKQPTSIGMRPSLVAKLDALAQQVGLSRSETVCRILGIVSNNLVDPRCGRIQIARKHLLDDILGV